MSFQDNTRRQIIKMAAISKGASDPLVFRIPKSGILARIYLAITGSVAGTLSAPNAFGMASIVSLVDLTVNGNTHIFTLTGPQYHYLVRDYIEDYTDPAFGTTARNAVTATTFDVSMVLPVAMNERDELGLLMLQNEQTEVVLNVKFEADATVATGATVTATVQPFLEVFTVPADPKDWPQLNVLHTLLGETRPIAATGTAEYILPRGNTYLQLLMGYGIAQSGADKFDNIQLKAAQAQTLEEWTPKGLDMQFWKDHGRARLPGAAVLDWVGSNGLGMMGGARDAIHSDKISDLKVQMNVTTQPDNWHIIRRQLIELAG